MPYRIGLFFLCCLPLFGLGCAQKSAKLQRSLVPPDQDLFETGTDFLEKGHYIRSRLMLQNLLLTYPDSEMTADAYFAIGDSYYEEGGIQNLLQGIEQYNNFVIFFPAHPKAPDALFKIMSAYGKMMGPPDRDQQYTLFAEEAARKFLEDYPDSDMAPAAWSRLVLFHDKLAQKELGIAKYYENIDNYVAAMGRLQTILDKFPDSNKVPETLFLMALVKEKTDNPDEAENYLAKIVSEYPFSEYAERAEQKLVDMGKPVPEVNVKLAEENRAKMRKPEGFSPITPLSDFVKALGLIGPPDAYEEAQEIRKAKKAAEEAAAKAREEKEKSGDYDIEDVIKKPVSNGTESGDE
jgi:outer membrane protein assembly factor BamD